MENSTEETETEYDTCVVCGDVTRYKKTDHVDTRMGYIEGSGQVCSKCNYTRKFIQGIHV
jgi:hypothetical protein